MRHSGRLLRRPVAGFYSAVDKIGYRAVDMIIRASGSGAYPAKIVDLGYQLVARGSTAREI